MQRLIDYLFLPELLRVARELVRMCNYDWQRFVRRPGDCPIAEEIYDNQAGYIEWKKCIYIYINKKPSDIRSNFQCVMSPWWPSQYKDVLPV